MKSLSFMTAINKLSYGICGFNIAKELIKQGIDVTLFPINNPTGADIDDPADFQWIRNNHHKIKTYEPSAPSLKLWHQFELDIFPNTTAETFGFPIFELDAFTARELTHLGGCDNLITCSHWGTQVLNRKTDLQNTKIHYVPLGVDRSIFYPKPEFRKQDDKCIFLSIGKIEIRKLSDLLPDIFAKAFTKNDNVELWMSFENIFLTQDEREEWIRFYKTSPLGDKIKIIPRLNTQKEVADLINHADFLIQLSRCEGFSLPSIEGLSCGKFILAGDYGGQSEFLDENNSFLVHIDEWETAWDGKFFTNNIGRWGSFKEKQIEQAVEHLRIMYKLKQNGAASNVHGIETSKEFSWENSAKKLIEVIS